MIDLDTIMPGMSMYDFADAVRFLKDMGYRDVRAGLYPGMRHEILMETGRDKVQQDIRLFVEDVLTKSDRTT